MSILRSICASSLRIASRCVPRMGTASALAVSLWSILPQPVEAQQDLPLHIPSPNDGGVTAIPFTPMANGRSGAIQQTQDTQTHPRSLHPMIQSLPQAQDDLEIIERRSQLVVTRANVSRIAIGDPAVVDVIQYSPKEFSILGLARGSTTLTFWFEGENEPVIYTMKTVRDPNADNQRKLDYGRLEKKLAQLFPNSKVYLIPMSFKILVRGQAKDSEEAAHILNVIRGEVINQEGGLLGPQPYMGYGGFGGGIGSGLVGGYANGYGAGGYGAGGGIGGLGGFGGLSIYDMASSMIINELRVPGEFMISLRVRVAELSRSDLDRAGVNLNVLLNDARHAIRTTMAPTGGGTVSGVFDNGEIGVVLDYLASNGTAKIVAEPQATVLSGRSVRMLAGGEFAVPTVVGVGGAAGATTSFRGFGTSLQATPTVTDRDLIRISIVAEHSDLNGGIAVGGVPGTNSRRIETAVEMREGQTLALAGLLSHRMRTEVARIPMLGDIPKVGPLLFSTKRMSQEENELLILVTPEIVRAMDAHEVPPVPGFEVTKPTCDEFYKYNMTEGQPDTGYYHLPPYGSGSIGTNVDYQHFNPQPAASQYGPVPTQPFSSASRGSATRSSGPIQNTRQLHTVPQASNSGIRPTRPGYSDQVMTPSNNGVRQTGYSQPTKRFMSR